MFALVFNFRMQFASSVPGRFQRGYANGFAGFKVAERGSHFSEVEKLQRALTEAASCHDRDRVRCASVDLHVGNEALALCAGGIVKAQQVHAMNRHPQANDLTRAHVSMGFCRQFFVFRESLHHSTLIASEGKWIVHSLLL